jgi:hypothetical protein
MAMKPKPKPNPTPTSLKQLKNVIGTQMIVPKDKETGKSLEGTERDRNTYRGTYGGKKWIWKNGIASLDK